MVALMVALGLAAGVAAVWLILWLMCEGLSRLHYGDVGFHYDWRLRQYQQLRKTDDRVYF